MAVNRVQGKGVSTTGTSTTITLTSSITTGNLLFSCQRDGNGDSETGQTTSDASNTWNNIDTKGDGQGAGGNTSVDAYAANVASGSYAVTLNAPNNGTHGLRGTLDEMSGCATVSPLNDHGTANNTSGTSTSVSVTTAGTSTNANDLVMGYAGVNANNTITDTDTAGTNDVASPNTRLATEWRAAGSGGSQTSTFTLSTGTVWVALIATFKAAGGATAQYAAFLPVMGVG